MEHHSNAAGAADGGAPRAVRDVNPDIELVIFDCDGVLVDSEPLAAEAMAAVLAEDEIAVTAADIMAFVGMKQADIFAGLQRLSGRTFDASVGHRLWPATRALFAERLQPTPDMVRFLDGLSLRRCVASSSSLERIRFSLGVTGLERFFDHDAIFSSEQVARGKPAPDLVLHAASTMGVPPERCVVIEDSKFGIMGAVAAGMRPVGFLGGAHASDVTASALREAGAEEVLDSWSAVEDWLRR